jgi:uncharacterized protein YkwD
MLRPVHLPMLLSALLLSPTALGQFVEGEDSEFIETALAPTADARSANTLAVAQRIIEKTNEFRVAQERSKITVSPRLTAAAEYFAAYMAKNDRYGHTADGNRPSERAKRSGYDYCLVSENIAYQYSSAGFATAELAEGLFEGWQNSAGHRQNMLDPDVTETGVAVARSEATGYWYAVQLFGRPASAAIEFQIANLADASVEYAIANQTFELPPRYVRTHTRCRRPSVTFELPGRQDVRQIEPARGDHYYIAREDGQLRIHKENPDEEPVPER